MTTLITIMLQLSVFLAIGIVASHLIQRSASRAHQIVSVTLLALLVLPFLSIGFANLEWGLFPQPVKETTVVRLSGDTDHPNDPSHRSSSTDSNFLSPGESTSDLSGFPRTQPVPMDTREFGTAPVDVPLPVNITGNQKPAPGESTLPKSEAAALPSANAPSTPADSADGSAVSSRWAKISWPWILLSIWACMSLVSFTRGVRGYFNARRILSDAQPIDHATFLESLQRVKQHFGITCRVELRSSSDVPCPVIWNWGTPVILLPESAVNDKLDCDAVFAHELSHRVRQDHWHALLAELVNCIMPWHPLVRYCRSRLYRLSELASDAMAIQFTSDAPAYAKLLLRFTPIRNSAFSSMATLSAGRTHLKARIQRALAHHPDTFRSGATFTLLLACISILILMLAGLAQTYPAPANILSSVPSTGPDQPSTNNDDNDPQPAIEDDLTDAQWKDKLTSIENSAHWSVGKDLGYELSQLSDGRGYQILVKCWNDIAVNVRKQILKGYYPQGEINSHFFAVMHLGMTSEDTGIQSFAITYLEAATLRKFKAGSDEYRDWYRSMDGKSSQAIVSISISSVVERAKNPDTRNVRNFVRSLNANRNSIGGCTTVRSALEDAGLSDLLDHWVENNYIRPNDPVTQLLATPNTPAPQTGQQDADQLSRPTLDSTDEQWKSYLLKIPDNARWFVGANAGNLMSQMEGDRALRILQSGWDNISPQARRQILKGFTPGFGVEKANEYYLDILELAMGSKEHEVRSTASTYLQSTVFKTFKSLDEFQQWRKENEGKTLPQLQTEYCEKLISGLEGLDSFEFETRLEKIIRVVRHPAIDAKLRSMGFKASLESMLKTGKMDLDNLYAVMVANHFDVSDEAKTVAVEKSLARLAELWESYAKSNQPNAELDSSELWSLASNLGESRLPIIIPTMIGIIEADNHYETVYGVGYFGLRHVTDVSYSSHHDGAWWRRWWEKNKHRYPSVSKKEIPKFTPSQRGRDYKPFPQEMDTVDGCLNWMIKQHQQGNDYQVALDILEDVDDPKIIPFLIGVLDSDNSPQMISDIGRCLGPVTGVRPTPLCDGEFWKRWWSRNKEQFPKEVRSIEIPVLKKTSFGARYEPFPPGLETLDGKIAYLKENSVSQSVFEKIVDSVSYVESSSRPDSDIPKLIALIESDNTYATIYGVGYFGLGNLTDIKYSPLHDGAWWRRWWEKNRHQYPADVRNIPIPELPKTAAGKKYVPYPPGMDTLDGKIQYLNSDQCKLENFRQIVRSLSDPAVEDSEIPKLIGIMEADNSSDTIYQIGEYALGRKLGIQSSPWHDGAWWRRWWERNKSQFDEAAQNTPIPTIQKTEFGKSYQPIPESVDSLEGTIQWISQGCPGSTVEHSQFIGRALLEHGDPKAIPTLIGWMVAEDSNYAVMLCSDDFESLTGIRPKLRQDPQAWKQWWTNNRQQFGADVAKLEIPDLSEAVKRFKENTKRLTEKRRNQASQDANQGVRTIDDDPQKQYFVIGDPEGSQAPDGGWKLLLILPGGDGSADFNGFCNNIHKHALPNGFLAVQLVAPVWSEDKNRVVWPTRKLNPQKAKFTTEAFIAEVVEDLAAQTELNRNYIFALGWSSGGPPLYANSLESDSPVTGTFVAMSVFWPQNLGKLEQAKDHPFFILHSPEDWIKIDQHARVAEQKLADAGAVTKLQTYRGGHGWVDNPYRHIADGVHWLTQQVERENED